LSDRFGGLAAHEVLDGSRAETAASVVPDVGADRYDLVLVAVRSDQLAQAGSELAAVTGSPTVLFFGNNPFAALRHAGVSGLPRNLATLHSPPLKAVAVRYWAQTMRSPAGELCSAGHARHAQAEMQILGDQVIAQV